ncbi:hypothetical protein FHX42_000976 [Saccharopolyspora lacisalsi]|uniref:Immunity protein Imm1 n=1 Tax=Halosaccharopolyspora lacisalsi TaxID=1000566 RepID=A0A839DW29_9PSEU|nr:Imm1 family immunity protein [Halosaccharopolyspora lacisalsi]MBA8823647.1 hypothetical protein [Halosaccharopolyspora lacisalsi]
MSNPLPQDEPDRFETDAAVFARLSEVPLEIVDKLIESTESVYSDLNTVRAHPYWADLVLHQGAAIRALREAREGLEAFRSEAVGARNTELGVIVATVVVDGRRYYAHGDDDKTALVDRLLRPEEPGRAGHLYTWDRPYEDDETPGPYQQMRVVTAEDLGVINYSEETEEGELSSWHTHNPEPAPQAPVLRFDAGSALTFPRDSVVPLERLRPALLEFARTGLCPDSVPWQQARWGD